MDFKKCGIFIDGDNFMYNGVIELFDHIKSWNMKVLVKRVYGDFSDIGMTNWKDTCMEHNLTSIHLWSKHGKNSVDMKMTCDIQEMLYSNDYNLDVFILCTGDRDFIPIIEKIHLKNKIVIGMSTNYFGTSVNFRNECDQFYYVNRRNSEIDAYKEKKSIMENNTKKESLNKVIISKKKSMNDKKKIVKKKKSSEKEECYSLSSDDFSMESFFEHTFDKKDKIYEVSKTKVCNDQLKKIEEEIKKKIHLFSSKKIKEEDLNKDVNKDVLEGVEVEKMDYNQEKVIEVINPIQKVINKDTNPTFQEIKNIVISLLKKTKNGIFISQIKDEILKLYPKFNEKSYNVNYTFSKFIKALEPQVKTRSTKVGVLYAYV